MKKIAFFLFILITSSAFAETSDEAYKSAHECYVNLKADAEVQKLREPWGKCITLFENVVKKYRRQAEGANAKYSLGKLYEGLADNSKNQADWKKAVDEYKSFARQFPRSKMADDAYFRSACIYWEKLRDKSAAESSLRKIIRFYKDGDKAGEASKYLKEVEAGRVPDEAGMKPVQKVSSEPAKALTIVIDPGHGGSDSGALGRDGYPEKTLTLIISKKTASEIKKRFKNVNVYLTRDDDKTLTLDERVKFANKKNADLFVSIHVNASTSKKERGVQTYYLNNATDEAATRLAKQENKYAGRDVSDLEKIIATMIQNESTLESQELARLVHKSLVENLSKKYSNISDQKVRSALFYVLVGVKCPSILVETSYISNPKEEKRLKNDKYQLVIASSIADGLDQRLKVAKAKKSNI